MAKKKVRAALVRLQRRQDEHRKKLRKLRDLGESGETELAMLRQEQETFREEIAQWRSLADEIRAVLAIVVQQQDATRGELDGLRVAVDDSRSELTAVREDLRRHSANLNEYRAVVDEAVPAIRQQQDLSRADLANLQRQIAELRGSPSGDQEKKDPPKESRKPDYDELTKRIGAVARSLLPETATVIAISKGDEELLSAIGRRSWHFPQTDDGVYAGHYPADSAQAIAHLEKLRAAGGQYLLVPSTGFWWLDYYADLRAHLDTQYDVIHRDESCLIYSLSGRTATHSNGIASAIEPIVSLPVPASPKQPVPIAAIAHIQPNGTSAKTVPTLPTLRQNLVTVIVPVYNAFDDVQRCIASLLCHCKHPHQVLLIDDCSPDERIWPLLQSTADKHPNILAVQNEHNLGYTATINFACRLAPSDVVLLNSDTEVTDSWLEKLAACAYSADNVATVTPLSNAAGAFSVPKNNAINEMPNGLSIDGMGALLERTSKRLRPSVPTGNGFCLYITRKAINAVGYFDVENFPRGYGEENDFCARAVKQGWLNLVDDSTFIFHRRSASFGDAKSALITQSRETLKRLHPEYHGSVRDWLANDPLDSLRADLQNALSGNAWSTNNLNGNGLSHRTPVLVVLHDGAGGTVMTTEDLMRGISSEYRGFLLRTAGEHWTLFEHTGERLVSLRRYAFADSWEMYREMDENRLAVLKDTCADFKFELAHVRHLIGNGPQLLDVLDDFGIPIIFSFHDFYTVCPTIQLVDNNGRFCGGTCSTDADGGVAGDCKVVARLRGRKMPALKHQFVNTHRQNMERSLAHCDAFVTTSQAAKEVLLGAFRSLEGREFRVIEHGRDISRSSVALPPMPGSPAKVVCLGNIDRAKGSDLIMRLLESDMLSGPHFEFHFLGAKARDFHPEQYGGIYHGRYDRENLESMLREIRPSFSMIASVWPETYCHTLTESWAAGIPVLASNIGTLKERIGQHGGGWLLDHTDPDTWYRQMIAIAHSSTVYWDEFEKLGNIPLKPVTDMAMDYRDLYRSLLQQNGPEIFSIPPPEHVLVS